VVTAHVWRLVIVVPVEQVASVVTWMTNNLGANVVPPGLGPSLNGSGQALDPETHRWCCLALTDAQGRLVLARLCAIAGVATPTPAQWNGWVPSERRQWWNQVRAAVYANSGIAGALWANEGEWDVDCRVQLAAIGLQVQAPAPSVHA
jgi:hypothetical protein